MPMVAHRMTPNRVREARERVWAAVQKSLGSGMICTRCRCTLATFADKCEADLEERCPGSNAIENVKRPAEQLEGLS